MKFGKELKKQMVPEWKEAYMDYNGLKRILHKNSNYKKVKQHGIPLRPLQSSFHRNFSGLNRESSIGTEDIEDHVIDVNTTQREGSRKFYETNFLRQSEEGGENEALFFRKLDQELNMVNAFYKDKVEEVMNEAELLKKQMDAFVALKMKVKGQHLDGSTAETRCSGPSDDSRNLGIERMNSTVRREGNDNGQRDDSSHGSGVNLDDTLEVLDRVKINNPLDSPVSTFKGVFMDAKEEELSFKKAEVKKVEEQLRLVLIEFYDKLHLLKHYSFVNLSAFSKILKKYEKITSRRAARLYMKTVDNSYIGSSDEITALLERVEATFIKYFAKSNRREGMKSLRPKTKREKHSVTFFTGFFSGCSIALLVAIILKIQARNLMTVHEGVSYMENIFPLYSFFAYIILHMLMYAANLYFWRLYRVNYSFIFGFKKGTELGYREVLLLSTGLAVLTLASFLANLQLDIPSRTRNYKTVIQLVPLALVAVVVAITFCPFNIIYRSGRYFFINCLFRCLCAPFYQVTLSDFFLADNLTSQVYTIMSTQVQAIRCLELYVCYYGLGEFSQRQKKCHSHGVYNVFYFIVAVIPYWIRFAQCFRRFWEDRESMHAYNGLKYFLTIVAVLVRTAFELKKGSAWMVLAMTSSAVAIAMSTYWDIVMDWGLLQRKSKNPYLRDKLVIPHKSVYFAAMALNVVLRVAWMQLVFAFNLRSFQKMAMSILISCLEIVRRGMWSFLRLENEHLNNVGKYRAFKSVPYPFNYYDDDEDDESNDSDKND